MTFGNGMVVRELIIDLDDAARRLAWSARGGRLTHHNAGDIRAMIEQATTIMKKTLEAQAAAR